MKKTFLNNRIGVALATVSLALLGAVTTSQAVPPPPTDSYTNAFNDDGTGLQPHSWNHWYGWTVTTTWDSTKDAAANATSGSLHLHVEMGGNDQAVFFGTFQNDDNPYNYAANTYDAVGYFTNIEFDILVSADSAANPATPDFGTIQAALLGSGTPNGGGPFNLSAVVPNTASNGWVHISIPVDTSGIAFYHDPGVVGVVLKFDSFGDRSWRIGKTNDFWIDNISVKFSGTPPPPPPPPSITSISKPLKNLNFFSLGSDYGRSGIRALGTGLGANYSWYNQATSVNPVTYEFTVTGAPGAGHAGFHTQVYLVPYPLTGANDNNIAPDYQEPSVIYLSLDLDGAGVATYTFRWKTNIYAGNGTGGLVNDYYSAPHEFVTAPTALGKWTCTFSNNVNVTLTSPSGVTTNFNIAPTLAAFFNTPIHFYFGVHPDPGDANKGQGLAISSLKVTGTPDVINADFTDGTPLDTINAWQYESATATPATDVFVLSPDKENGYFITWPLLNSSGFVLQTNSVIASTGWSTNGLPDMVTLGVSHTVTLSTNSVDVNATRFFRLASPGY